MHEKALLDEGFAKAVWSFSRGGMRQVQPRFGEESGKVSKFLQRLSAKILRKLKFAKKGEHLQFV